MSRLLFLVLIFFASSAFAGGSFSVEDEFAPIKKQIPELWQALNMSFDIRTDGFASRIGNDVNPRLGHRRVGPYCLAGKPKGQKGSDSYMFCFVTEYIWLDENGKKSSLEEAFDVQEEFVSLELSPL
jgi:hypothetical protein